MGPTGGESTKLKKNRSSVRHFIAKRYTLALLAIAGLSFAAFGVVYQMLAVQEGFAGVINISGRQRMLSQRIAKLIYELEGDKQTQLPQFTYNKLMLLQAIREMEKAHIQLTQGRWSRFNTPTIQTLYFKPPSSVDSQVKTYLNLCNAYLQSNQRMIISALKAGLADKLLLGLNDIVGEYENEARMKLNRLEWVEIGIVIVTMLLLLFELFAIFAPMSKAIATQQETLQREQDFKNHMISVISHELRTPVTSIQGSLALLKGDLVKDVDERNKLLGVVHRNCERLTRLLDSVLDAQMLEAQEKHVEFSEVELRPFLKEVCEQNQGYVQLHKASLEVAMEAEQLPTLQTDPDSLNQILTNLISNAAKFSPEGGVITLGCEYSSSDGVIRLYVADEGPGIPEEFQDYVFQLFAQVDPTSKRKNSGTGIGLYITKKLVVLLGGSLSLQSQVGHGSIFSIELPIEPHSR